MLNLLQYVKYKKEGNSVKIFVEDVGVGGGGGGAKKESNYILLLYFIGSSPPPPSPSPPPGQAQPGFPHRKFCL